MVCINNVSLSTSGRRTFQSVDGDPEVAPHLPLPQDTCLLLADERWAAMQELSSHSAPAGLQMASQIPGSGRSLFQRGDGSLPRTLNGITPVVMDNERDFFG